MRPLHVLASLAIIGCLQGGTVESDSFAPDLIGGTVTVTRFGGAASSATFVLGLGGSVEAISPGSAGFSLTVSAGNTIDSTWTLTNTDPSLILFNRITAVTIDLLGTPAKALFDNDGVPSTPFSTVGRAGVLYVGGKTIGSATEYNAWSDPANLGDMFTATSVVFAESLGAGDTSSWKDDTDLVAPIPEPATLASAGLALLLLAAPSLRRRREVRLS